MSQDSRNQYSLVHLSDGALLRGLTTLIARHRFATVDLIAHVAEVERRRLYAELGCPSMFVYCVRKLGLSEDVAYKSIRTGRASRRYPAILPALADGRLHVSGVVLLAPYLNRLTRENARRLLAAAAHSTRKQILVLLAEWFPNPDLPTVVQPIATAANVAAFGEPAPALAESVPHKDASSTPPCGQLAPGPVGSEPGQAGTTGSGAQLAPGPVGTPWPRLTPLSPGRVALQVTIRTETHEKLQRAQALLRHVIPSGDVAEVLDRALDALVRTLEKKKFGATENPRRAQTAHHAKRTIPAAVRRAVRQRDGGRCTFVGASGDRCSETSMLEFDHVVPVGKGGRATVNGIRLLCRAHNQYEAERVFGAGFMARKVGNQPNDEPSQALATSSSTEDPFASLSETCPTIPESRPNL